MKIKIQLANGEARMLRNDAVDLRVVGPTYTWRASHVEPDNANQDWVVTSAKTGKQLGRFSTHAEAIAWEKEYFGVGGIGWKESQED